MVSFVNGLNGTLATVLLCALLYVDEAGLPLPLAPNEVLLLLGGLLIGTGTLNAFVFLPLALLAMAAGMLTGFVWARLLGDRQLSALARRVHAQGTYDRATARLRTASPAGIGLTRMLPGVRTYATLVAGAAQVDLRRFLVGAIPALILWLLLLTTVGALVGVPAEHVVGAVDGLAVSGVLLVLLGVGSFLAISRIPRAEREAHPLEVLPGAVRLGLAVAVDVGIVASLVAGVERVVARVVHPGHPFGRVNDVIIVIALAVIGYVVASRRAAGATLGEGLFTADYRAAAAAMLHRRRDHRDPVAAAERDARSAGGATSSEGGGTCPSPRHDPRISAPALEMAGQARARRDQPSTPRAD